MKLLGSVYAFHGSTSYVHVYMIIVTEKNYVVYEVVMKVVLLL